MNVNSIRAAFVALAIALVALPASASAQELPFNFGITSKDGFGISFGSNGVQFQLPNSIGNGIVQDRQAHCMTTGATVELLGRNGYRNIDVYDRENGMVVVSADYRRQPYFVVVDPCRRAIVEQTPITGYSSGWQNTGWR